ncbi:MAG: hypothetical protein WCK83_15720 [Burkholderiales bacterium]
MQLVDLALTPIDSARGLLELSADRLAALLNGIEAEEDLGNKYMKLFVIFQNFQMDDFALEMQAKALQYRNAFRFLAPTTPRLRLLAIVGPGNMTDNAPLDFVLFNQNVQLDYFYVVGPDPSWEQVPDHDVAILALGESSKNALIHQRIEAQRVNWPRPFLNHAEGVMRCARDRLYALFKDDPDLCTPRTLRVERRDVGKQRIPFLIRPIDLHAGEGFEKIEDPQALESYLGKNGADCFYLSEYIDCSRADGLFRKFRIALIDKKPYVCHLAVSESWVVHYISAHMELSLDKRQEEERFMNEFNTVFLRKHGQCLDRIADKIDLDYVVLDCAESVGGKLILFEADNGGWIHDTDSPVVYPYKSYFMNLAFEAFTRMLESKLTSH